MADCGRCGADIDQGRSRGKPREYCSGACRQAAYRERQAEEIEPIAAGVSDATPRRRLVHRKEDTT